MYLGIILPLSQIPSYSDAINPTIYKFLQRNVYKNKNISESSETSTFGWYNFSSSSENFQLWRRETDPD